MNERVRPRLWLASLAVAEPPVHEEMPPRPLAPYGAAKLSTEAYCSAYAGSYGFKTLSMRFSNVYGPRSFHKGSVIARAASSPPFSSAS